jgi:hypothetical protein
VAYGGMYVVLQITQNVFVYKRLSFWIVSIILTLIMCSTMTTSLKEWFDHNLCLRRLTVGLVFAFLCLIAFSASVPAIQSGMQLKRKVFKVRN